ncbi:MAG: hypothetical protein QF464_05925, partial [Myxococcota bacterium]|nr:hypothetical protein [Myxococcota bacterium]
GRPAEAAPAMPMPMDRQEPAQPMAMDRADQSMQMGPVEVLGDRLAPTGRALTQQLRRFGETDPRPLYAVLRRPHLHVLLTCTIGALADGDRETASERARHFVFQLLAELAMEGALEEPVRWAAPAPVTHITSAALRVHQVLPTCALAFVF